MINVFFIVYKRRNLYVFWYFFSRIRSFIRRFQISFREETVTNKRNNIISFRDTLNLSTSSLHGLSHFVVCQLHKKIFKTHFVSVFPFILDAFQYSAAFNFYPPLKLLKNLRLSTIIHSRKVFIIFFMLY